MLVLFIGFANIFHMKLLLSREYDNNCAIDLLVYLVYLNTQKNFPLSVLNTVRVVNMALCSPL